MTKTKAEYNRSYYLKNRDRLNAARGTWGDEILWLIVAARWPERVKALPVTV